MAGREALSGLPHEALLDLAVEQNDKLKELLAHFRMLQEENSHLRGLGGRPADAEAAELRGQLMKKDEQIADMEEKITALVSKTKELLEDYKKLQATHERCTGAKGDVDTRERGVAVAPSADAEILRAENQRLQQQLEEVKKAASSAAADTAEVAVLRNHNKELERLVRDLRQQVHDTEVRARVAEALAKSLETSPEADGAAVASSCHKDPVTISNEQVAGMAAAAVGAGGKGKKSLNMEGYLHKQGGGWGPFKAHFKERYFELRGAQGALYYSSRKGGEQIGEIPLEHTTCAVAAIRPFAFCLFGPKLQRNYILAANSEEERSKWMEAISRAAEHYTSFIAGAGAVQATSTSPPGSFLNSVIDDAADASCVFDRTVITSEPKAPPPTLQDFELLVVIGVGSFGRVMKVRHTKDNKVYAMKVLQKEQVVKNQMVTHTKAEKNILEDVEHPFVVKLHFAFQTRRQLVFILDFLTGGELFFHLANERRFSEQRARFYAAEIALALDHLHSKNVIYRDLKPENLVLDGDGHVTLTDFGLAKTQVHNLTHTFCGTPQYMAPELILKHGHGKAADWWSLGVFLFEMIAGVAPFPNMGNPRQLYEQIVTQPPPFPAFFSPEAKDCVSRLLVKDPAYRLRTLDDLQRTAFFKDLDFGKVLRKEVPVPFKPQHRGDDTRYVDAEFKRERVEIGPDALESKEEATIVFDDFTFVRERT